jgi:flagellar assembly protein FliH
MSSRILAREGAASAVPIRWRRTAGPAAGGEIVSPEAAGPPPSPEALEQFRREAAAAEAQARRQGYQEGEEAARKRLAAPYEKALGRLTAELAEFATLRRRLRREAEEDLVQLAIAVARRVLRRELSADPSALHGIIKAALDRLESREILRLRLHPHDAPAAAEMLRERGAPAQIEVAADPSLERGAFLVETARGTLDASIETQLREIERGLTDLVRRRA